MLENTPSRTAELVALMRALENSYYGEKSLLKDKYAARFLSDFYMTLFNRLSVLPDFMAFFVNIGSIGVFDFINLRHAFMDAYVKKYAPDLPLVLLGAGYDSRALRLAEYIKHGVWEFDFPATQRRKKFYLRNEQLPATGLHYCEVDFMKESLQEIFEKSGTPRTPTIVIWEGVSMYVSEEIVRSTLTTCGKFFGPGTIVLFDYWHRTTEQPVRNLAMAFTPFLMELIYNERFTFGAGLDEMRKIALECGAKKFSSFSGKQMMAKLSLTSRLPFTSAAMAVVEF